MTVQKKEMFPRMNTVYGTLPSMLRKYDKYARKDAFQGNTREDFRNWQKRMRSLLRELLGFDKMEECPLTPVLEEVEPLAGGIRREHIRIQTEPDVWMPMYVLIPEHAGTDTCPVICPPGHNGAGKYTVAGVRGYQTVDEKIEFYHYDYGMQLARLGYVAVCPDCRGFGERREDIADTRDSVVGLKGDCYWLAHMGEPLGIPVAGMLTWDLMRALDYIRECGCWDCEATGCVGFSGGGMQTLWLAALDERLRFAVISGYFYGFKDSLLTLNRNCSCNYVPHLWEHLDMGDIASLIAPRPLLLQSCAEDRLNGPRGLANVMEQAEIVRNAYQLCGAGEALIQEICEGMHQWHGEHLKEHLEAIKSQENLHDE